MSSPPSDQQPSKPQLGAFDAACVIIGIIIGSTIYQTAPFIFRIIGDPWVSLGLWAFAGVLVFIGALCYAELATAYPRLGGDYNYLTRAYGPLPGYLFGWTQLAVIQTSSIGLMAFVFGDYTHRLMQETRPDVRFEGYPIAWDLGDYAFRLTLSPPVVYAVGAIVFITLLNILGVVLGKVVQNLLTVVKVLGLAAIVVVGFVFAREPENHELFTGTVVSRQDDVKTEKTPEGEEKAFSRIEVKGDDGTVKAFILAERSFIGDVEPQAKVRVHTKKGATASEPAVRAMATPPLTMALIGLPMVLILLAYGGWNDAAFVAAEVRDRDRNLPRALLWGTLGVVIVYLLVNGAYIVGLGYERAAEARNIAADVLQLIPDEQISQYAVAAICVLVMISALGAVNGLTYTSSRIYSTLGSDYSLFAPLGRWSRLFGTPIWSLLLQMIICLTMVLSFGTPEGRNFLHGLLTDFGFRPDLPRRWGDGGFEPLLKFGAPIFWTFFLMAGLSLFVLRINEPSVERPFRVPLYPITPLLFCATCAWMIYRGILYAQELALVGFALVLLGFPFYVFSRRREIEPAPPVAPAVEPTLGPRPGPPPVTRRPDW